MSVSSQAHAALPPTRDRFAHSCRFSGVCATCPSNAVRRIRHGSAPPDPLPPAANGAIAELARCRRLTRRERDVLSLCCLGRKNRAIALALGVSPSAVRRHLRNLHRKTNTADKADLVLNLWHATRACAKPVAPRRCATRAARRGISRDTSHRPRQRRH